MCIFKLLKTWIPQRLIGTSVQLKNKTASFSIIIAWYTSGYMIFKRLVIPEIIGEYCSYYSNILFTTSDLTSTNNG